MANAKEVLVQQAIKTQSSHQEIDENCLAFANNKSCLRCTYTT